MCRWIRMSRAVDRHVAVLALARAMLMMVEMIWPRRRRWRRVGVPLWDIHGISLRHIHGVPLRYIHCIRHGDSCNELWLVTVRTASFWCHLARLDEDGDIMEGGIEKYLCGPCLWTYRGGKRQLNFKKKREWARWWKLRRRAIFLIFGEKEIRYTRGLFRYSRLTCRHPRSAQGICILPHRYIFRAYATSDKMSTTRCLTWTDASGSRSGARHSNTHVGT